MKIATPFFFFISANVSRRDTVIKIRLREWIYTVLFYFFQIGSSENNDRIAWSVLMFLERFSNLDKIERINYHWFLLFPSVIGSSEDNNRFSWSVFWERFSLIYPLCSVIGSSENNDSIAWSVFWERFINLDTF